MRPRRLLPRRPLPRVRGALAASLLALAVAAIGGVPADAVGPPALGSAAARPAAAAPADVRAWLDEAVPALLDTHGIAGATVAAVAGGEVVAEAGYGSAGETPGGAERPVDPESTLFRIGSVSKLVTAAVVVRLAEDGVLDLDAPVTDVVDVALGDGDPITLRHLLTHTAGLEDQLAGLITGPDAPAVSLREAATADPPERVFAPGTTPAYSNYGNGLAAFVAETATGRPYADLADELVFGPAGMPTATLEQPLDPAAPGPAVSAGVTRVGGDSVPFEVVTPAPAGAVSASAADLSAFLLAQLDEGDDAALGRATLDALHAPAFGAAELGGLAAGPRMTLGFFEGARNGHRTLGHDGSLTAFHSTLELIPDAGAGIAVSLNSAGLEPDSTPIVLEALAQGFADLVAPDAGAAPEPTPTAAEHAAALAGPYEVSRRAESTFLRAYFIASRVDVAATERGTLTVSAILDADRRPIEFVEVEPWVWRQVDGSRLLAADVVDGEVRAIGLNAAFTLQPMPGDRAALPLVAAVSASGILALLLVRPVAGIVRLARRRPPRETRGGRIAGWLAWAAALCLPLAAVPWVSVAAPLLSGGEEAHVVTVRAGQALLALAGFGVVPAVVAAVLGARGPGRRWPRVAAWALAAAAFAGLGFVLVVGGLLLWDVSY